MSQIHEQRGQRVYPLPRNKVAFRALMFAILSLCISRSAPAQNSAAADPPLYERDVRPIFQSHCYKCHGHSEQSGGIDLRSVALMRKEDLIVTDWSSNQTGALYHAVVHKSMPPSDEPSLSDQQIDIIRRWIEAGAPAGDPDVVYGSGFFQTWGTAILISCGLNLIIIAIASQKFHSYGFHVQLVSMLPAFGVGASTFYWYPPDLLSIIACTAIPLGFAVGGGMVSRDKGYGLPLGVSLGLFLSTFGLIALALLKPKPPIAEPAPSA